VLLRIKNHKIGKLKKIGALKTSLELNKSSDNIFAQR
jgi:hypothetical protein